MTLSLSLKLSSSIHNFHARRVNPYHRCTFLAVISCSGFVRTMFVMLLFDLDPLPLTKSGRVLPYICTSKPTSAPLFCFLFHYAHSISFRFHIGYRSRCIIDDQAFMRSHVLSNSRSMFELALERKCYKSLVKSGDYRN